MPQLAKASIYARYITIMHFSWSGMQQTQTGARMREHITTILASLHSRPVHFRAHSAAPGSTKTYPASDCICLIVFIVLRYVVVA